MLDVPGVDLLLQLVTNGKQRSIPRRELRHQRLETTPEHVWREIDGRQQFLLDEIEEHGRDAKRAHRAAIVSIHEFNRC